MKKFISVILASVLLLSVVPVCAKVGDVIGTAYHTDIVAYINNYAIPSYAVNGTSVIVAEDLRNFGFDVVWNSNTRSLNISRNGKTQVTPMDFMKTKEPASKYTNILSTDISVYAYGHKLTSYAMNGYTMIPLEELSMFGEIYWDADQRALKLWIDGLNVRFNTQRILGKYYAKSKIETFTYVTGQVPTQTSCVEGSKNGGLFGVNDEYKYVYTYQNSGKTKENYLNLWGEYMVSLVDKGAIYVDEDSYYDEKNNMSRFLFFITGAGELCIDIYDTTGKVEVDYYVYE